MLLQRESQTNTKILALFYTLGLARCLSIGTYFLFNVLSYVLLYSKLVHRFLGNLDRLVLHLLALRLCELRYHPLSSAKV